MRKFVLLGFVAMLWACTEEPDCDLGVSANSIQLNFYSSEDSTALQQRFVQITERESDSIFYNSDSLLTSFSLNLSPYTNQVTYVFQNSTSEDTITLGYTKELRWLSETCGPYYFYDELTVIGSSFTYELTSSFIDVSIDENIKVYN